MVPTDHAATPRLVHRAAFETILSSYKMNERAKKVLNELRLVLINGPSASGRNTVIERMLTFGNYRFIVSDTTRPMRVNNDVPEQNGREYWFRSEEEVLQDLQNGEYLEAELIHDQQVSGMSIRELEAARAEGKIAINEVEIGGLKHIAHLKPDTMAIIMLPPSYEEWMRRLNGRGQMTSDELKHRLETATIIFNEALTADYATIVINNTVEQTAIYINELAQRNQRPESQQRERELAADLLEKTKTLLSTLGTK